MSRHRIPSKSLSSPLGSIDEEGDSVLDEFVLDDAYSADMAGSRFDPPRQQQQQQPQHYSLAGQQQSPSQQQNQQQQQPFTPSPFFPTHEASWSYAASPDANTFHPVNAQAMSYTQQPMHPQLAQSCSSQQFSAYTEHPPSWQPLSINTSQHENSSHGLPFSYGIKSEDTLSETTMLPPTGLDNPGGPGGSGDGAVGNHAIYEHSQHVPSIASPQSETGWLSTSSSSEQSRNTAKREAIARSFADFPSHMRREGVRKKNARVEIPDGRTIDSIEEEIRLCDPNDEEKLKRLKQYKRLLRNREAALSSRSRKKEHAQKLEEDNKILRDSIERYDDFFKANHHEFNRLQQVVQEYAMKEEEMIRRHTLETAELRKKIAFLTEEAQGRTEIPMSSDPSSAGYSDSFTGFDHLSLDQGAQWNDYSFMNPSCMNTDVAKAPEATLSLRQKNTKAAVKEDEPAVAGLLLTLLLCGAWVASNSIKPVAIPEMPEDVRMASAAVLNNIYKDAGLEPHAETFPSFSGAAMPGSSSVHSASAVYPNTFDPQTAHAQLTTPSYGQQRSQAFSLSVDQYSQLTTDWFADQPRPASPARKRNLAEALANLQLDKQTSAGSAYTKSLLMDRVPSNVVRDFHRMVAERNPSGEHLA